MSRLRKTSGMRAIFFRTLLVFAIWYSEQSMRLSHGVLIGKTIAHPVDHRVKIPARHNVTLHRFAVNDNIYVDNFACSESSLRFPSYILSHTWPSTAHVTLLPKIMPSHDASRHAGIATVYHTTSYQIKSSFFTSRTFSGTCGVTPSPAGGFTTGI